MLRLRLAARIRQVSSNVEFVKRKNNAVLVLCLVLVYLLPYYLLPLNTPHSASFYTRGLLPLLDIYPKEI